MPDTTVEIIIAIISAIGAGGVGAAIVSAFSNRKKNKAEADKLTSDTLAGTARELTAISTEMVTSINAQLKDLTKKYKELEEEVARLKLELLGRERMINELKLENKSLRAKIEQLQAENVAKDALINELSIKVKDLEDRLDKLTDGERKTDKDSNLLT